MSLDFEHVNFQYPGARHGVDDVTLSATQGELLPVMGRSGSGKSTLLRLAAGLLDGYHDRIAIGLLPEEDARDANPSLTVALPTGLGITRNALIARASVCLIAVGGGLGTLSEIVTSCIGTSETEKMCKPIIDDELRALIDPLLPPPKPRREKNPGRLPVSNCATLTGILFVLKTGLRWRDLLAEMGCGSGVTCWRRLRDW